MFRERQQTETPKMMDSAGIQVSDARQQQPDSSAAKDAAAVDGAVAGSSSQSSPSVRRLQTAVAKAKEAFWTFGSFVGPGFMISVAYSESCWGCSPFNNNIQYPRHPHLNSCKLQQTDMAQSTPATTPPTSQPVHPISTSSSSSSS
jgi:hypothetical protein